MATETNPYLSFDDKELTDDFGFSFSNEDDIVAEAVAPSSDEIADLKKRLIVDLLNDQSIQNLSLKQLNQ